MFANLRNTLIGITLRQIPNIRQNKIREIKRWVAPTLVELQRRKRQVGETPLHRRSSFLEWNYDAELFAFGKRLGEEFNKRHLQQALINKSYINMLEFTNNDNVKDKSNQSVDIDLNIGDNTEFAKKGEVIIRTCINNYFKYPECIMEAVENYLMSEKVLAHVGFHIGLKDLIFSSEYPPEETTLANTFKAVVAALNDSSGPEQTDKFVKDILFVQLIDKEIYDIWNPEKPYEMLEDLMLDKKLEPRLCRQSAVNTILANYQIGIYCDKKLVGIGWGESVEIAKHTAAMDAIKKIYKFE